MGARGARSGRWNIALMGVYAVISLVLIGLHPLLPYPLHDLEVLVVCVGAAACVGYGRRSVVPEQRRPWTLLLLALAAQVSATVVLLAIHDRGIVVAALLDAVGAVLFLAGAVSLIVRRGIESLGGVVHASVLSFAAGVVLWILVPHRFGPNGTLPARLGLFAVVFALTGAFGALLWLANTAEKPDGALWWLVVAVSLAVAGNLGWSVAGSDPTLQNAAVMLFMDALTAVGLFGLDPTAKDLISKQPEPPERDSMGRLVSLGVALAVVPVLIGAHELVIGDAVGVLLAAQGALVAVLVILRIGVLSAQRARAERALAEQATRDPLTHLPNRRQFAAELHVELGRRGRCALFFCDLDGFKAINDRFGHDAGDSLLVEVASRLRACVNAPHVVSRFGGDEFAALLVDTTPDQAQAIRASIETALRRPFEQVGGAAVGVSIGVAFTDHERDPEQLIRVADRDMYREKASHANDSSHLE